jgi:hypothetical protein
MDYILLRKDERRMNDGNMKKMFQFIEFNKANDWLMKR